MQTEVAYRIAEMDRTNPEVLREVERILESKFSSIVSSDFSKAGGVEALASIINRSDRTTEKIILEGLEMKDPEITEKVRELMFVFEDLILLDDRSVQRVMREIETKDLAMALKGANEQVKEKIFKNMSERAAAMLADDMEYLGPVRSKDVQEKQSHIVGIIRSLEETGELVINRGSDADDFIS
jgi:flagellar motor switch protein FliG